MTRLRVPLLLLATLLVALGSAAPVAATHTCDPNDVAWNPENCERHETPAPTAAPTAEPTPQPTPEPEPEPTQEPAPQPQPQPQPDPTAAPQRDTSPNTTTTRSTPRPSPTASPDGTPEPTPLESIDPEATPEILVQGPVLDDSDDEERLDVAQGASEHEGSGGWAFFLVGFLLGGAIGWVGRGVRTMRRRRKQQLFG